MTSKVMDKATRSPVPSILPQIRSDRQILYEDCAAINKHKNLSKSILILIKFSHEQLFFPAQF